MKKVLAATLSLILAVSFCGCGSNETNYETSKSEETAVTEETTTTTGKPETTIFNEQEIQENTKDVIYDTFKSIEYFSDDDVFIIDSENGSSYIVDKNGKALYLSEIRLKSKKIKEINGVLYDINEDNITDRFIKNSDTESVLGVYDTEDGYIVWTEENIETPTSSKRIMTAFDYDGNKLFSIDSDEYDFVSDSHKPRYFGENVFAFTSSDIYMDTNFNCVNIDTGEFFKIVLRPYDRYSKGYIIDSNKNRIVDTNGNIIFDGDDELEGDIFNVGEGIFVNFHKSKFYNMKDLSLAADLSEYTFTATGNGFGGIDWEKTQDGAFEFIDGYCGIRMENDNNIFFFGIIDKSGNWVKEPEKVSGFTSGAYNGKITDDLLSVDKNVFNIKTKESFVDPVKPHYLTQKTIIDGIAYYIDENGYFCSYDYNTEESETIEVYLE